MSVARQFLRALIDAGKLNEWTGNGNLAPLFKGDEVDCAEYFAAHVAKYGKFPALETLKLETGEDLPKALEPAAYYRDKLKERHRELELKRVVNEVNLMAKNGGVGWSSEAWALLRQTGIELNHLEHSAHLMDLRDAEQTIVTAYVSKQQGIDPGVNLGWPTLDNMAGGLRRGDMISLAGRPGIGKTWAMLYAALHVWMQGQNDENSPGVPVLFVSMEMDTLMVAQRMVSMISGLPFKLIKGGKLTQGMPKLPNNAGLQFETLKEGLLDLKGSKAPFWVMDGNLASTADDVAEIAVQLAPEAAFVDAAYLLKHPTERDRYRRVAENADVLKKGIANAVCPVITSWQLKREEGKKKKKTQGKADDAPQPDPSEDVTLDDIGYADAIGQVSSLVLGIFEGFTPEEQGKRKVRVLKGRSGEVGSFLMNWDFKGMEFGEFVKPKPEDLQM